MPKYSYEQIKGIWIMYGGNPAQADTAAAIALAESGGNSDAISPPNYNGTLDRGLFQINSIHGARSTTNLANNVRAAIAISGNGSNWRPWSTYWSRPFSSGAGQGTFRKFLKSGAGVDNNFDVSDDGGVITGVLNPLDPIKELVDIVKNIVKAGEWFTNPKNTIRIAQVVGGMILSIVGLSILNVALAKSVVDELGPIIGAVKGGG